MKKKTICSYKVLLSFILALAFITGGCAGSRGKEQKDGEKFIHNVSTDILENREHNDTIDINSKRNNSKAVLTSGKAGNNSQPPVELAAGRKTYPYNVSKITLVYKNNTDNTYMYGEEVILEKKENGKWKQMEPVEGAAWNDIGIILMPKQEAKQRVPLSLFFPALERGDYRLVKKLYPETQGQDNLTLYAAFKIKAKPDYYIRLEKEVYPAGTKYIKGTIYNTTGKTASVVLAPQLEKKKGSRWIPVKCREGFCGTGDPLEKKRDIEVNLKEWYPNLKAGKYRLSYQIRKQENSITSKRISVVFELQ